jgi:hypothetical protein
VDDDLTRRAERAVLGAMIKDQRIAARLDCLETRDFTDPRHRAVFQAVRMLSGERPLASVKWRSLITATAGRPVTADYLDGLVAACPHSEHGPAYAAMLIQASLDRVARERADSIDAQAALLGYEGNRLDEAGGSGGKQAARLGAHLAEVARAIRGHTAALAPGSPDATSGVSATDRELSAGLARATLQSAGPVPGPPQGAVPQSAQLSAAAVAEHREELVLSALLRRHPQAGQILAFLPAAAFTSPARQETFRAIHRVSMSGRPVDELTVCWDLATRAGTSLDLSPGAGQPSSVPAGYVDKLARADVGSDRSPLRVAHDLSALLQHRSSARRPHALFRRPGEQPDQQGHSVRSGPVPAQTSSAPLNQPPAVAEPRRPGLEQGR